MASKKDIEKESMYKKLMPTPRQKQPVAEVSASHYYDDEYYNSKNVEMQKSPVELGIEERENAANEPTKIELLPNEAQNSEPEDTLVLLNLAQKLVIDKLPTAFAKFNCCSCARCKKDVTAIALNKLPPRYVVLMKGEASEPVGKHIHTEITAAIIKAILTVRANPRHDPIE